MRYKILFILGAAIIMSNVSAQKTTLTMQQCVEMALTNNRNIKQKELNQKTAGIAYEQSKFDLLPSLSGSASQGWSFGRSQLADGTYKNINSSSTSYGISGGITIFDGLRMKYNIDQKAANLKASEANLEMIKRDVILSVSTAFLNVLLKKELLQIANEQLSLTRNKVEQQKALINAGKLAEGEIYELVAQEAKEYQAMVEAENNLEQTILELAQVIELDDYKNLDVEIPVDLMNTELNLLNPQSVYDTALLNRPDIKSAEYMVTSSENEVNIAKSSYFPSLSLGANIGGGYYNSEKVPLNTIVGFELKVPIFNRFETKNQVRTAKLNVENSRLNLENSKIELRKVIQQAYHNAISAKARWDAALKSELAAKEAYRFTEKKFEVGKASVYELYQAKNNLTVASSEIV